MKMLLVVLMLTLVGCASKQEQPRVYDTQWSDFNGDIMLECGEVAGKLAEGDDKMAEALYNQCLFEMGTTI